jgi:acetate kinase
VHRLRRLIAGMAASLDRLDALVFTGGVGEHAGEIRERACVGLGVLGVQGHLGPVPEGDGAVHGGGVPVLVVHAREDVQIAREVRRLLTAA